MNTWPNFDFKIDCGDDPKVRQWLHDNGCTFGFFGKSVFDIQLALKHLCFDSKHKIVLTFDPDHLGPVSERAKRINPYDDYMQPENDDATIAERMAALIEKHKQTIPNWAQWICVMEGWIFVSREKPRAQGNLFVVDPDHCLAGTVARCNDSVLNQHWRETLTELPNIKPDLTVAPVRNDRIVDNNEMIERDERHVLSAGEWAYNKKISAENYRALTQPVRELSIPPICLRDQAMPMMLGDGFGGDI